MEIFQPHPGDLQFRSVKLCRPGVWASKGSGDALPTAQFSRLWFPRSKWRCYKSSWSAVKLRKYLGHWWYIENALSFDVMIVVIHLYPCKLAPCFSFCLDLGSLVASQFCVCDCHLSAPGIICWSCWTIHFRGSGFTRAFLMWSDLLRQQQQLQQQMQQQQQQQQQLQQQMQQQQQLQQQQLLQMQQLSPQQLQQLQMQLQQQITLQWGS